MNTVTYRVHFVGSLDVPVSMNTLSPIDRENIAYECIYRICRAANFITKPHRHKCPPHIARMLGEPTMQLATRDVDLVIGTDVVQIIDAENIDVNHETSSDGVNILFEHQLPLISFASPGVGITSDFMCYFGKDSKEAGRRCLVLECVTQSSTYVLATFRTAFEQRMAAIASSQPSAYDRERRRQQTLSTVLEANDQPPPSPQLISFDSPRNSAILPSVSDQTVPSTNGTSTMPISTPLATHSTNISSKEALLTKEVWFHGPLDRPTAESLLRREGDFLVRVSTKDATQFVLTGLQNGKARHLLLVDDNGKITTKDREFDSISHLVQYHRDNNIPIASPESAILLSNPVLRRT